MTSEGDYLSPPLSTKKVQAWLQRKISKLKVFGRLSRDLLQVNNVMVSWVFLIFWAGLFFFP